QGAAHTAQVAFGAVGDVGFARAADANLDVFKLAAPFTLGDGRAAMLSNCALDAAGHLLAVYLAHGKDKPQVFIGLLGPPIIVVGEGAHLRRNHVHLVVEDQRFVIVGGVVGTGDHHAAHLFFPRDLIDVIGHLDV